MSERVLGIDPGAERCGWAVVDTGPTYIASGILAYPKDKRVAFQVYRMALEQYMLESFSILLDQYHPDIVVNEIVPSTGGGNFAVAGQGYLANVTATILHSVCINECVKHSQVAARTVQAKIAVRAKTKNITKVQVRNGVLKLLPDLQVKPEWTKVFDEVDAIAISLHALKCSN